MSKAALLTTSIAAALTFTGINAEARVSSDSEFRGYKQCLESADEQSKGLVTGRSYLIDKQGAHAEYFINATRWEDGERARVRINCETAGNGNQLLSSSIELGSFTTDPKARVRVEIAQK